MRLRQDSFVHLLEKGALARADSQRGRFRNFLHGALDQSKQPLRGCVVIWNQRAKRVGDALNLSLEPLKTSVHRLRGRYWALLRAEVARTVATPGQVDEEFRYLRAALRASASSHI